MTHWNVSIFNVATISNQPKSKGKCKRKHTKTKKQKNKVKTKENEINWCSVCCKLSKMQEV